MKRIVQIGIGLVYLAVLAFSLVVMLKAGASVFYKKALIDNQALASDGNAYEYHYAIDHRFYNPDSLMVLEDGVALQPSSVAYTTGEGQGFFAIKNVVSEYIAVVFSPTVASNPAENGHVYSIYIRPHLISNQAGGLVFLVLLGLLLFFLADGLLDARKRAVLLGSPLGVAHLWLDLLNRRGVFQPARDSLAALPRWAALVRRAAVNVVLVAFLYVLMEWVFFVTKPSFMDILSWGERLKILLISGLVVALIGLLSLAFLLLVDLVFSPFFPKLRKYIFHVPAALLAACLCLILVDNFTYTLFKFGIVRTNMALRVIYALALAAVFITILSKMAKAGTKAQRVFTIGAPALLAAALVVAGFSFHPVMEAQSQTGVSDGIRSPNIIFFLSDGISAENMSLYGYERKTTPFLDQLGQVSFVSQNSFANAGHSMGSDTALLTGRLPLNTRVLYPPDTLKGKDSYQHLPGILKRIGYHTVSLGVHYFVDVNKTNFQNAFDAVNCVDNPQDNVTTSISGLGYDDAVYFLKTISGRISERLAHILFINDMPDSQAGITRLNAKAISDQNRIKCLVDYLDTTTKTSQPLFAHVHLMDTHGAKYNLEKQEFSLGQEQNEGWMPDFYDDSILSFDDRVRQIVDELKARGMYDNTILVIGSDHASPRKGTLNRIPLVIHFPNDQYSGITSHDTQQIDIAATMLDYIGVEKPDWMQGDSLLQPLDQNRLVFSATATNVENVDGVGWAIQVEKLKPPFYQFGSIYAFQCQNQYIFNLVTGEQTVKEIPGYLNPCAADQLVSAATIQDRVAKELSRAGFRLPEDWMALP